MAQPSYAWLALAVVVAAAAWAVSSRAHAAVRGGAGRPVKFQHNKHTTVTRPVFQAVAKRKLAMLNRIDQLMHDAGVRYTIGYGGLLENVRGDTIYQDDDLDIIFATHDLAKWEAFCKQHDQKYIGDTYNLDVDARWSDCFSQRRNGLQLRLAHPQHEDGFGEVGDAQDAQNALIQANKLDIHADIISDMVRAPPWILPDIDFSKLARTTIDYKGEGVDGSASVAVPSHADAEKFLEAMYGKSWKVPLYAYTWVGDELRGVRA